MKTEYDFSKGERGKFYIPKDKIRLPFYFNQDIERRLLAQSERTGKSPMEIAAAIMDTELRLMETLSETR
jgi:hypothetical protein